MSALQLTAPSQLGRRSDMDPNGHINNVAYLAWALEVIPEQIYQKYTLTEVRARQWEQQFTGPVQHSKWHGDCSMIPLQPGQRQTGLSTGIQSIVTGRRHSSSN